MAPSLAGLRERGPVLDLTLAACRSAGCRHRECRAASAAHERLALPVDATGSARRLQALAYNGWSQAALAARLDVRPHAVRRLQDGRDVQAPADLAAAVSALYDRIWHVPGGSAKSAQMARQRGWCPPLAWDDDNDDGHGIDDPAAAPADWKPPRRLAAACRTETITELMAAGATTQQAAWRLGTSRSYVLTMLSRARRVAS